MIDKFVNFLRIGKSSADTNFSKTKVSKIIQPRGFNSSIHGPLTVIFLSLMKDILIPLAKRVLITLGLTDSTAVADAGIHQKDSLMSIS